MKVGAERNKVLILCGLLAVGGYLFYSNVLSSPGDAPRQTATGPARSAARATAALPPVIPAGSRPSIRRAGSNRSGGDWRPSLQRRPDDPLDPLTVDPTLRLDLLAKVQGATLEGGSRNLFQFSTPPPPPAPPKGAEPKIPVKTPQQIAEESKPKPPAVPVKPPPPPINLKYYGYSTPKGGSEKTAFFLDGDEILVAGEGATLKRRYKVVRIGVNSVVMEDTESKHQQTLPLAPEAAMG